MQPMLTAVALQIKAASCSLGTLWITWLHSWKGQHVHFECASVSHIWEFRFCACLEVGERNSCARKQPETICEA